MQRCSRCLSMLIQHVSHPVSPFVVFFNLFDCMFLQLNTVVIHHCFSGQFLFVFLVVGLWPLFLLVCCFFWRNANLAGGFAGRLGWEFV